MSKLNCVFCATPGIAKDTLVALTNNPKVNLSLIISMPDRPAGRGKELRSPEVINIAKELNIDFIQTNNLNKSEEFSLWSKNNPVDVIIVFAFAQFLGSKILNTPKLGCFNIHTSLLPKYRGAAPMQHALFNGDTTTGICIQRMVKKMDAGNIVCMKEISILPNDDLGLLHDKFQLIAPELVDKLIEDLTNNSLQETTQNESLVSFAPSITKNDTLLDFRSHGNIDLHNKIRGLSPIPSCFCFLNGKRLKVFKSELSDVALNPEEVSTQFNTLLIGTNQGSLRLCEVQLEGKSRCSDFELINGFKNSNNKINISSSKDK